MSNYLMALGIILLAIISLTFSSSISVFSRDTSSLKEDLEVAVHDAALQVKEEALSEGHIHFDEEQARKTFVESLELNTGMSSIDYRIVEFELFDHSNSTFPVEYVSSKTGFKDTIIHPTVLAIVETKTAFMQPKLEGKNIATDSLFELSNQKNLRVASYTYKLDGTRFMNPIIGGEPNFLGLYWPVPFTNNITSHYSSYRKNPISGLIEEHRGIDIAIDGVINQPTIAISDGVVTFSGELGSYGNIVEIKHDNGLITRSAHLNSISVSSGEKIKAGQVIGLIGSTGNSTGPHLHFETIYEGSHVNPLVFYRK